MGRGNRWRVAAIAAAITGALVGLWPTLVASQSQAALVPQADTCTVDSDGTEHVMRVVPVPGMISPQAQKHIAATAFWAGTVARRAEEARELFEQAISP